MSDENLIECPSCHHQFALTEALMKQLTQQNETRFQAQLQQEKARLIKEMEVRARASAEEAQSREKQAVDAALSIQKEQQEREARLRKERDTKSQEAMEKLMEQLNKMQAEKQDLLLKQQALEFEAREKASAEAQKQIESVTVTLQEQSLRVQHKLEQDAELKLREKEMQLTALKEQLADASRRADQGSQQAQGAALEASFEELLKRHFPADMIVDVPTGVRGADIILEVRNRSGMSCGRILFETKRTKSWDKKWVPKLREDLHRAHADLGVIVTQVLPDDIQGSGEIEGLWISDFTTALPLIASLRWGMQEVQLQKRAQMNAAEDARHLFNYVTSQDFRNRVKSITTAHASLRSDIASERRAMEKIWNRRESQLGIVEQNIIAMIGSIEGNSGHQLEDVASLELEDSTTPDTTTEE